MTTRRRPEAVTTRIHRLLAMLRHAAGCADGVTVAELAARFGVDEATVGADLAMAQMIGGDSPNYDDMPFDVFVDGDRVHATLFSFQHALRFSVDEGLALLASADALLAGSDDPSEPLARALRKVGSALGLEDGEAIDVAVDPDGGEAGRLLQGAIEGRRRVRFTYWSYARDVVSPRRVEPWRVGVDGGAWYLVGLDVDKAVERRFRLDRMDALTVIDEVAAPPPKGVSADVEIPEAGPQAVLDLPAEAAWVLEAYPVVSSQPRPDGRIEVTLAVAGASWLERLLLRVGPAARLVRIDPEIGDLDLLAGVARRILSRYA